MASWIRPCLVTGTIGVIAACGDVYPPGLFQAVPTAYLTPIDQLRQAGFEQIEPPAVIPATKFAETGGSGTPPNGLDVAAGERFFRTVSDIATTNGPIDIASSVGRFRDRDSAAGLMARDIRARDSRAGEQAISTGPLGEEAHGDEVTASNSRGTKVIQFTVEWRIGNLLNIVVVRGRSGGTRIGDAVAIARTQVDRELGLVTSPPAPVPSPSSTPRAPSTIAVSP